VLGHERLRPAQRVDQPAIADPAGLAQAVGEIARVLEPGGRLTRPDFQHTDEYERVLREHGRHDVARSFGMYSPVRVVTAPRPN